ncbi:MAG: hypothetical protein ACXWE5_12925, partial [Actinomycetota bacterium]
GIEAAGEPGAVERRGSRWRAGVLVASVTAVGVFLGAVGFAATQVGREVDGLTGLEDAGTFASPDFPWTMPVPEGWHAGGWRSVGGPRDMIQDLRTSFVTNSAATIRGSLTVGTELPPGVADTDVLLVVDPFVGTGEARPTTLVLNAERDDTTNAGWAWRDGKLCGETGCARVYIWHGARTSDADLATATSVAEGVRLVKPRPDPSTLSPSIFYLDGQDGFSMSYPAGWTVAEENLTPELVDPREIVSVGTYTLRPGGEGVGIDAYLPGRAFADLGPADALITVQEYEPRPGVFGTPRPSTFDPATACGEGNAACREGTSLGLDGVRAWWIPFSEPSSGRAFYAFVAMGEDAYRDPGRSGAVWAVLDSLSFDGANPPASFPVPALGDYDFVPVEGGGSRIWPRSGSADVGVRYRFEVGHCGLAHITDFDGSFWKPILRHPIGPDSPSVLINGDRGIIRMSDREHAVYTASTGQEVALLRVEGPIVVGGCI